MGINVEPKNKKEYFKALDNINSMKPLNEKEAIHAKKTFFFYECMQLNFSETSIVPSNRFLSPEKFLKEIIKNLKTNKFNKDKYYKNTYRLIKNNYSR